MTQAADLKLVQRTAQRDVAAAAAAEQARAALEAAIRRAAKTNSVRAIAVAAGLSKSRVHQIAKGDA